MKVRRLIDAWVAVALGLLMAGCYNPKIDEGAFLCGPNGSCPSGFHCVANRCFERDVDGGTSDGGDTCTAARLACSPVVTPTGACDPVCQSGCPCGSKCTFDGETTACKPSSAPAIADYDDCDSTRDKCASGSICLSEFFDSCGQHCYRFCRVDADCSDNARCSSQVLSKKDEALYKICSPRIDNTCNPTGTSTRCVAQASTRTSPPFACYLLSTPNSNETLCECAGSLAEGAACTRQYECKPGNECVEVAGQLRCRKLCTPDSSPLLAPVTCGLGMTCVAFPAGGSRRFGYCL